VSQGGTPVAWLAVVCTDRSTHKRTRLADVRFRADGGFYTTECGIQPDDDRWIRSWEIWEPVEGRSGNWFYEFHCGRCGRHPRIGRDNWNKIIEAMHPRTWPNGVLQQDLDVSLLPF